MEKVRVRFAPSPTGFLHIGGARTALYNWLFARQKKGKFILRIEDTDAQRSTEESIQAILEGMKWLGMDWDEGPEKEGGYGPYFQSQRLDLYKKYIQQLIQEKKAYYCFCTEEELNKRKEEAQLKKIQYKYDRHCLNLTRQIIHDNLEQKKSCVVRLKNDKQDEIRIKDLIKGEIEIHSNTIDDFIILRSDGYPIYNFAVVVDDALMQINYVIRGDDHISNTPKQILLYEAMNFPIPQFAHVPMILGEDKSRLSKRHGATAVQQYREEGYLPEAMINYLVRLGWSYDDKQEIFSRNELLEKFSIEKISKNPAVFNVKKLEWLNDHYIQQLTLEERTQKIIPFLINAGLISSEGIAQQNSYLQKIVEIVGNRIKTLKDIAMYSDYFFIQDHPFEKEAVDKFFKNTQNADIYLKLIHQLTQIEKWTKEVILKELENLSTQIEIKRKDYFQLLRIGLTGKLITPDLLDIMLVLGKERTIEKLNHCLKFIKTLKTS